MQREHRLALTKNYRLLVQQTPVDDIMDELVQRRIVSGEQREYIAHRPTRQDRTRTLLALLPRRGPQAFQAFCQALLSNKRDDLVMVITDANKEDTDVCCPDQEDMDVCCPEQEDMEVCCPNQEDMEMCCPNQSSFDLGRSVFLKADREGITLKDQKSEVYFTLVRWVKLQHIIDDIDEAVRYLEEHNRYASLDEHLGGNVYVTAESPALTLDIRHYTWKDDKQYPSSHGITLDFQQYKTLKKVDSILGDVIPDLNKTLPCEFSHQNPEGTMYCSECSPN